MDIPWQETYSDEYRNSLQLQPKTTNNKVIIIENQMRSHKAYKVQLKKGFRKFNILTEEL